MNTEERAQHKKSSEYQNALGKFSNLIWIIGFGTFALSGFITLFAAFNYSKEIAWGGWAFGTLFTYQAWKRLQGYILFKDACIGYALGLDVDKRLLKNIENSKRKIFKEQYKINNWKQYLSSQARLNLKEKEEGKKE